MSTARDAALKSPTRVETHWTFCMGIIKRWSKSKWFLAFISLCYVYIKHLLWQDIDSLIDVSILQSWNLKENNVILHCKIKAFLGRNLTHLAFISIHIVFISKEQYDAILWSELPGIVDPHLNMLKTLPTWNVIHYDCSFCVSVVTGCDSTEFFLSCCVKEA